MAASFALTSQIGSFSGVSESEIDSRIETTVACSYHLSCVTLRFLILVLPLRPVARDKVSVLSKNGALWRKANRLRWVG